MIDWGKWFIYEPDTGLLRNRIDRGNAFKAGDVAGHLNKDGYLIVVFKGKQYQQHRIDWEIYHGEPPPPGYEIDHENHIRHDNRICNLRLVTRTENQHNRFMQRSNTTGIVGVNWRKNSGNWQAQINVNGKRKHLGTFNNLLDAAAARKHAEHEYGFHPNHGLKPHEPDEPPLMLIERENQFRYEGVRFDKCINKYRAYRPKGRKYIGVFPTQEEAYIAVLGAMHESNAA